MKVSAKYYQKFVRSKNAAGGNGLIWPMANVGGHFICGEGFVFDLLIYVHNLFQNNFVQLLTISIKRWCPMHDLLIFSKAQGQIEFNLFILFI
jgi:hypothetical protein